MALAVAIRETFDELPSRIAPMGARRTPVAVVARPLPVADDGGDSVMAELDRVGTPLSVGRGQTVVEIGDAAHYVFKVSRGTLRAVRLLNDGRRHIARFLSAGDFFGLTAGEEYSLSVEAVEDAAVVRYARRGFEALLDRDPRLGRRFFSLMCRELSAAQDRLLLLGRKNAAERMASFLLAMAQRNTAGAADPASEIELPMSRTDVADYLGLTIETVSRLLTHLRSEGIIDMPRAHRIVLVDREALEELSDGEAAA
jgi:CRP/FNR family transcriptional regulator, anaerobic regulatory protein